MKQVEVDAVAGSLTELSGFCNTIDQGIKGTETPFLEIGQALQAAHSDSGHLIQTITDAANKFNNTSGSSLVRDIETTINGLLSHLNHFPVRISEDIDRISLGIRHLDGLCSACGGLMKIPGFLKIMGINFGIEASRSKDAVAMFAGFSDEIKTLSNSSADVIDKIKADSRNVVSNQKQKIARIWENLDQIKTLSDQAREAVQKTIDNIRGISAHSLETLNRAQNAATAVQSGTGEIVMAIQFHDIARQRLEHVISAFGDVGALWDTDTGRPRGNGQDSGSILPFHAVSTLKIQSEQLGQVAEEVEQAHCRIHEALEQISTQVADLTKALCLFGQGSELKGLSQAFQAMAGQLEDLKQIQDQAGRIEAEVMAAIRESSGAVEVLSRYADQISNINIDIKYKALNAIIMTNKLGRKGRTLEVLATEVRDLSVSCNSRVKEVVTHLDRIVDATAALTVEDARKNGEGTPDILSEKIKAVSRAMADHIDVTAGMPDQAEYLEKSLRKAQGGLTFMAGWVDQIRRDREKLDAVIEAVLPFAGPEEGTGCGTEASRLSDRYTMESEREIHQRITGRRDTKKPVPEGSQTPAGKDGADPPHFLGQDSGADEFDDNIELF